MRGAAVLVLGLTFAALASTAQPAAADLSVRILGVQPPQWLQDDAVNGNVSFEVRNDGSAPAMYRVDFLWVVGEASEPLNGDASRSFDLSSKPMAAGERRILQFRWSPQPGQEGPGQVVATLQLADGVEQDRGDNTASAAVDVPVHRLALQVSGPTLDLAPGATGFSRIQVRNEGNRAEDVVVAVGAPDEPRLHHRLADAVLRVGPGMVSTTHLLVRFDPAGDFRPVDANYTVTATPSFTAPFTARTAQVRDAPDAGQDATFTWQAPAGVARAPATGSAWAAFALANTGPRMDNYTFAVALDAGWRAQVFPADACLLPGESTTVTVQVTPPAGLAPGAGAQLRVAARGSLGAEAQVQGVEVRVGGPAPQVLAVSSETPYAGRALAVNATLANAGDQTVPASTAVFSWRAPVGGAGAEPPVFLASAPVTVAVPALEPGASLRLPATLAPPSPLAGPLEYGVSWPAGQPAVQRTAFVHVPMFVVHAPAPLNATAGSALAYRVPPHAFQISNVGNAEETVAIRGAATLGDLDVETRTLRLAPGERFSVPVALRLPDRTGAAGESVVNLTVTVAGVGLPQAWNASVRTPIVDREAPAIAPAALPATWPLGAPFDFRANLTEASEVAWARAEIDPPVGGNVSVALFPADGQWRASHAFDAVGLHAVRFRAADRLGNNGSVAGGSVLVVKAEPTRLAWLAPDGPVVAGSPVGLAVESQVPILEVEVSWTQDGRVTNQTLPVEGGRAALSLAGAAPGQVALSARATDWQGRSVWANTTLDVAAPAGPSTVDDAPAAPAAAESGRAQASPGAALGAIASLAIALALRRKSP